MFKRYCARTRRAYARARRLPALAPYSRWQGDFEALGRQLEKLLRHDRFAPVLYKSERHDWAILAMRGRARQRRQQPLTAGSGHERGIGSMRSETRERPRALLSPTMERWSRYATPTAQHSSCTTG